MQDDNRRRAERRAEKAGVEVALPSVSAACNGITRYKNHHPVPPWLQAELPVNLLRIDGRSSSVRQNEELYQAVESMEGMIPMNGLHDNLIDRFDGRALLDFYREPVVGQHNKQKTEDELELEEVMIFKSAMLLSSTTDTAHSIPHVMQLLAFESYRDLIKILQQNLTEEQGLIAAELQNIEERASARSAAAAALGLQAGQASGPAPTAAPAGESAQQAYANLSINVILKLASTLLFFVLRSIVAFTQK